MVRLPALPQQGRGFESRRLDLFLGWGTVNRVYGERPTLHGGAFASTHGGALMLPSSKYSLSEPKAEGGVPEGARI